MLPPSRNSLSLSKFSTSMACMNLLVHAGNKHFIVLSMAVAFFLISSSTPSQFLAQGRQFPNANLMLKEEERMGGKMRSLIGSRPPKCDKRCRNCGHCEAVQVPIVPATAIFKFNQENNNNNNKKNNDNNNGWKTPRNSLQYSRGDDVSSYKPMCWKCKCGNFFFNP